LLNLFIIWDLRLKYFTLILISFHFYYLIIFHVLCFYSSVLVKKGGDVMIKNHKEETPLDLVSNDYVSELTVQHVLTGDRFILYQNLVRLISFVPLSSSLISSSFSISFQSPFNHFK